LPDFLTGAQVCEYLNAYATHFKLHEHIVFSAEVQKVVRNSDDTKWELHLVKGKTGYEIVQYDKVVFCTGAYQKPIMPTLQGSESFNGKIIHAQAFKRLMTNSSARVSD
jgi:dimethylaniline monooxygenase (N-oxide forming)